MSSASKPRVEAAPALLPRARVFSMENHDAALGFWRSSNVSGATLVHVDAHHDAWFIKRDSDLSIANFLCPALRDGVIDEVFWVIPDGSWVSSSARRHVLAHMTKIAEGYQAQAPEIAPRSMSVTALGGRLTAVPLRHLPRLGRNVVLDVDTDFMVLERVIYSAADAYLDSPWCWPEELLAALTRAEIKPTLATIAYSVTGSYTPLQWKYLGDEFAARLCGEPADAFDALRAGAAAEARGDFAQAERLYLDADPSAASCYRLALLMQKTNRIADAQQCFRRAAALDESYRTPFRSRGFALYWDKKYAEAEAAHRVALQLDPADAAVRCGLGQALAAQKRWAESEIELRAAAAADPSLPDAQIALGDILGQRNNPAEAVAAYGQYLRLTLSGHKTLQAPICSVEPAGTLDPRHFRAHSRRAAALAKLRRFDEAEQEYRIALAADPSDSAARRGLARAHWNLGRRSTAAREWLRAAGDGVAAARTRLARAGRKSLFRVKTAIGVLGGRVAD